MDAFGKISRHHWKERYKINKIAKFESDLLKTNEDTAPQGREITDVCMGGGGGGGGAQTCPPLPTIQTFEAPYLS